MPDAFCGIFCFAFFNCLFVFVLPLAFVLVSMLCNYGYDHCNDSKTRTGGFLNLGTGEEAHIQAIVVIGDRVYF